MKGIFISYRREDTAGYAGRLYDRLAAHFGPDRVFMDVEGIEPESTSSMRSSARSGRAKS